MAAIPTYIVEILDNTLQPITQLKSFVPLDTTGNYLNYSTALSDSGKAVFRVATLDPVLTKYGNILQPWTNHVRISRNGRRVWQGYIQDEPHRNQRFIEVNAYTYLNELKKLLVSHNTTLNGENMRLFNTGTMANAIIAVLNEAKAKGIGRAIKNMTLGTITNPNFPAGFTDALKNNIGGLPWTFSPNFQLNFDFKDTLYVIGTFANYSYSDFELTSDLVFNFQSRIGTDRPELVFEFGQYGMIEDFEAPLDGKNEVNSLTGLAADLDANEIILPPVQDTVGLASSGLLEGVAAYSDVKNQSALTTRVKEDLRLNGSVDTELRVALNENAYPLGQYGLGDTVSIKINHGPINENSLRQIVGIKAVIHNTGREHIILTTNKPRTYS